MPSPNIPLSGENLDNTSSPFHPLDLMGEGIERLKYYGEELSLTLQTL